MYSIASESADAVSVWKEGEKKDYHDSRRILKISVKEKHLKNTP